MDQKTTQQYISSLDVDKKIISSIDNGILILDDKLNIYYFNKWLELHTSLKEENVLGKRIDEIFENIKVKTLVRKIKTALKIGTPTFYTADTSKYLIPIKINQLNISNYTHMQQDVSIIPFSQQKRLVALIITDQTNMSNTNALLKANIDKVKELNSELIKERDTIDKKVFLIKFNKEAVITDVSQAYLKLIGYEKDALISLNYFDFEKFHIYEELKEKIMQHMKIEKVFKFEHKMYTKNAKKLYFYSTLVPEYDNYANHIGYILFKENITSSKELIEHQEKLLLNSRSAAMGEMIGMIAHQWRQPLSTITASISNLIIAKELETINDKMIQTSHGEILNTVKYLSQTINDFRTFFKPNRELSKEFIHDILTKSMQFLKSDFTTNKIKYTQEVDKNLEILTYRNELIQSLMNIFKNALDAHKHSKVTERTLMVKAYKDGDSIFISITDNAGALKKEIVQKVFEPYYSTKSKNGTGLGLYMCKIIIEDHLQGEIAFTNENRKTTVLIELPLSIHK